MKKFILDYICKLEGYKTAVKSLHWNAKNLSQHKLCDDIADLIGDFQDTVSEIEQGINGKLPLNQLAGKKYKVKNLVSFLEDVLASTLKFYKKLQRRGDSYIGLRSECETFMGTIQKQIYLANFTLKEEFKRRIAQQVNEERKRNTVTLIEGENAYSLSKVEMKSLIGEALDNVLAKRKVIKEAEDYDPWMNGDASWIEGEYDIPYGYHVKINTFLSYVSVGHKNTDDGYFFQGDKADNLIKQIAQYWSQHKCSQKEAVNAVISGLL